MNIPTPDDSGRGQVGIGTLIIFIALVLVAAVAAGVLIDTSGQLESRASDTGADAQAEVSNQVEVVSATAETDSSKVQQITLVLKKSAGADPIDLDSATIQYTSDEASKTIDVSNLDTGDDDGPVLSSTGDREAVTIEVGSSGDVDDTLNGGESAELKIVDQSGASTVYGVNVPDVISSQTYVGV